MSDCLEILEYQPPGTLRACTGFAFPIQLLGEGKGNRIWISSTAMSLLVITSRLTVTFSLTSEGMQEALPAVK